MSQGLRNFLAVSLSLGVLILWYTVISPPPKPLPQQIPTPAQQAAVEQKPTGLATSDIPSSSRPSFGGGKEIVLENEAVRIALNSDGGVVTDWRLKKYKRHEADLQIEVSLVDAKAGSLNTPIQVDDVSIPQVLPFRVISQSPQGVELGWESKDVSVLKRFKLSDGHRLDVELEIANPKDKTIELVSNVEWGRSGKEESPQRGILFFKSPPDRWQPVFYKDETFQTVLVEKIPSLEVKPGKIGWIGAESRYFLGGVLPLNATASQMEIGKSLAAGADPLFFQKITFLKTQILPREKLIQKFEVFGGPKELKLLKEMGHGFEKAIGYGWTTIIALPILYLLQLFHKVVHNYGLAIIFLTVLIKILLNPINRKSLESMKGMQALQPELKKLQEKFKNDKEKLNGETMRLFKAHKVNPMSGCLPMLLQLPIYIALYRVLWSSVELYQAPFFWFYKDLSAPDPFLITPILLGITMLIQTKMTPSVTADPAQQKMMMLMPLMFCAFMIFLPMGLGLYIFVNTAMTILQQWMYRKGIRTRDLLLSFRR